MTPPGPRDPDEDEVVEVQTFGGGERYELRVGLDRAKARLRGRFVAGQIDADEFEAEMERLIRKETER